MTILAPRNGNPVFEQGTTVLESGVARTDQSNQEPS